MGESRRLPEGLNVPVCAEKKIASALFGGERFLFGDFRVPEPLRPVDTVHLFKPSKLQLLTYPVSFSCAEFILQQTCDTLYSPTAYSPFNILILES